ncbi:MAG: S1/P1 nuclease [Chthoniobacterales bacterium]
MTLPHCRSRALLAIALLAFSAQAVRAYGPDGHHIVGAIADELLANTPAGKKIAVMLDGMSLREAAQTPDTIKGWDKKGIDDPKNAGYFSSRPRLAAQLREFWKANQPTHDNNSPNPSHHWFHYTDVPVEAAKYASGKTGRSQWDIVHMITYCIGVLRGEIPENNPRKITKPVAIILLAHYLGDIHQPLHVGAAYFDASGHPTNPDLGKPALDDQGGNSIMLEVPGGLSSKPQKLHSFWDGDPVKALLPGNSGPADKEERKSEMSAAEKTVVHAFASIQPKVWRMPANLPLKDYAEAWANEILPIAREAHSRLDFQGITGKTQDDGTTLASGVAHEKQMPDHLGYRAWAGIIVKDELQRAGWRLADLLTKCVAPGTDQIAPGPAASESAVPAAAIPPTPAPAPSASAPDASPYGMFPSDYKKIVGDWLRKTVRDPTNAMVQWQSEPKPADLADVGGRKIYGYLVIVGVGSKSSTGVVGPMQTHTVLIHDDQVVKASGF